MDMAPMKSSVEFYELLRAVRIPAAIPEYEPAGIRGNTGDGRNGSCPARTNWVHRRINLTANFPFTKMKSIALTGCTHELEVGHFVLESSLIFGEYAIPTRPAPPMSAGHFSYKVTEHRGNSTGFLPGRYSAALDHTAARQAGGMVFSDASDRPEI
jgi:hypothetical protein